MGVGKEETNTSWFSLCARSWLGPEGSLRSVALCRRTHTCNTLPSGITEGSMGRMQKEPRQWGRPPRASARRLPGGGSTCTQWALKEWISGSSSGWPGWGRALSRGNSMCKGMAVRLPGTHSGNYLVWMEPTAWGRNGGDEAEDIARSRSHFWWHAKKGLKQ